MERYIQLESLNELDKIKIQKQLAYVDDGSEGECFLGNDGLAYKLFFSEPFINDHQGIEPTSVIMEQDLLLECFAFPKTLYTLSNEIKCYTTRFVNFDLFKDRSEDASMVIFSLIDNGKFKDAYMEFLEELKIITANNIKIFDLCNNMLYDGEKITAIDTIYYTKNHAFTPEELWKFNLSQFNAAIQEELSAALADCGKESDVLFDEDMNIDDFLEEVLIRYDGEAILLKKIFG